MDAKDLYIAEWMGIEMFRAGVMWLGLSRFGDILLRAFLNVIFLMFFSFGECSFLEGQIRSFQSALSQKKRKHYF